jgi:hypothetical protein
MENLTLNLEKLYEELKDTAFNEGAFTLNQWSDLAEALIEGKRNLAEIDSDHDLSGVVEALKSRYEEFKEEIQVM